MDDHNFDELARALSRPRSRRALAGVIGASLATVLGSQVEAARRRRPKRRRLRTKSNSACAHFCNAAFPPGPDRGRCKSAAAHGDGPCSVCGPAAGAGHPDFCGDNCCPAALPHCDAGDCKQCLVDDHCGTGQVCDDGACCTPPDPRLVCEDTCTCASIPVTCGPPIDCGAVYCDPERVGPFPICEDPVAGDGVIGCRSEDPDEILSIGIICALHDL